jgi:diguanylate cyclase (GGDEF)-like protein
MSSHSAPTVLLVANPDIRSARLWQGVKQVRLSEIGRRGFSIESQVPDDAQILIYQIGSRVKEGLMLLEQVSKLRSDLCVIFVGKNIGADPVAQLLRQGAYDYLTWPCTAARLSDTIAGSLVHRRTFLEVRSLSGELAKTNQALARDREVLTESNRQWSVLNRLTQALSGSLETEAIIKALFSSLPELVSSDLIGVVQTNPDQAWTWSRTGNSRMELAARKHLLNRVGHTPTRRVSPSVTLRLVRDSQVEASVSPEQTLSEQYVPSRCSHDVSLAVGSHASGMLHVERARPAIFSEQERQLLATVGAALALALRNSHAHRHLQELALKDPLTRVLNRRALDGPLDRELKAGHRYGTPACLLLLDLDYFKTVNDLLGHMAGDDVLKSVAVLIQETVRDIDSLSRYGGEEFAVVLPHTDRVQAQALAERIRAGIERRAFDVFDGQVRLTASIGLAPLHPSSMTAVGDWIAAADSALYEAKAQGRNRVAIHHPDRLAPAQAAAACLAA